MMTTLILILPHFSKPFMVECDALGEGQWVVLMQEGQPIVISIKDW